jgi:hypothetical protein
MITTRYSSFSCAAPITCHQSCVISNNLNVIANGNDFHYFYSCALLDFLNFNDACAWLASTWVCVNQHYLLTVIYLVIINNYGSFTQCLISTFQLISIFFVNMFWNPIFIFYLDKQHPVWVEKLLNVLVHTHVSVSVFARTPFDPFWWSLRIWSTSGCLASLSGLKGRKMFLYTSFLTTG